MLRYAVLFLVIALVAGLFGFGLTAGLALEAAKLLFIAFLVLFVLSLLFGSARRFRDALRADRALAAAYEAEKWRVAEAVGWDKAAYAVAKGPFIEAVLARLRVGGQPGTVPREA